jgi:AAA+ superfamily predicted ATPase
LYRAEKWGAVLLIDEADTYISQRGDNIVQNCIVGIFLRLLEYFNGVLFLTTNRFDIIDDAIMSRVTAHIKYEYPNQEETLLIWKVLTKNFGLKIQESSIAEIYHKYETFSGRDIRNFLKMYIKTSSKKEITYQSVKELQDFLPFIKNRCNE